MCHDNPTSTKVVYPDYRVHNPPQCSTCTSPDCLYQRLPGPASDLLYPLYFSAKWTMCHVFSKYAEYPPSGDGKLPDPMKEGVDYQASYRATYYDSTWRGPNGEVGANDEAVRDAGIARGAPTDCRIRPALCSAPRLLWRSLHAIERARASHLLRCA
jgi:hypothetical protein